MRGFLDLQTRGLHLVSEARSEGICQVICWAFASRMITQEGNIKNLNIVSVFELQSPTRCLE